MDGALLEACGLRDLDEAAQRELLARLHADLEHRVGLVLVEGMSEEQLDEFGRIVDGDGESVTAWLTRHAPGYESDPLYLRIVAAKSDSPDGDRDAARIEFAASGWLALNRPDYRDRVHDAFTSVKTELQLDPVGTIARLLGESGR